MSLLLVAILGAVLAVTALAFWLRRPGEEKSGESFNPGDGSNLSAATPPAAEPDASRAAGNDTEES